MTPRKVPESPHHQAVRYICPECGGGFPRLYIDQTVEDRDFTYRCIWCGTEVEYTRVNQTARPRLLDVTEDDEDDEE